jgi:glycosyltransferase involved in cell wall biosynthesis
MRGKPRLENVVTAFKHIFRFTQYLVRIKPDVVHIGTSHSLSFLKHSLMVFIARLKGIKVVLTPHCGLNVLLPTKRSLWHNYVLFTMRQCAGLAVLSKEWLGIAPLLPGCIVTYVPNALELSKYTQLYRPKLGNDVSTVEILFLGHIGREKGIFDLIKALNSAQCRTKTKFHVSILGESLNPGEVDQAVAEISQQHLDEIVQIFPPEYGEQKLERLQSADIFVLPSYTEGMPNSIIEAMAAGLPVVASCVGGIPDMITQNQEGFLFSPGDVEGLVGALLELIEDPDLRLVMGEKGRSKALSHYSMDIKAQNLFNLYQIVVD